MGALIVYMKSVVSYIRKDCGFMSMAISCKVEKYLLNVLSKHTMLLYGIEVCLTINPSYLCFGGGDNRIS
jgi:hypothetical protein